MLVALICFFIDNIKKFAFKNQYVAVIKALSNIFSENLTFMPRSKSQFAWIIKGIKNANALGLLNPFVSTWTVDIRELQLASLVKLI